MPDRGKGPAYQQARPVGRSDQDGHTGGLGTVHGTLPDDGGCRSRLPVRREQRRATPCRPALDCLIRNPQQWCHAVPAPGNAHRDYRSREAPEQCTRRTLRQELRVRRLLAIARAPRPTTPPVGCARCGSARIVDSDSASSPGTRAAFPSVRQEKRSVSPARGHAACASRRISRAWPSPDRRHAWHPAQQLGRRTLQAGRGQGEVLQIARRPERTGDVPRSVARLPIARTRKTRYP